MDSSKVKLYDGKTDVSVFLTRVGLVADIKEFTGEKKAKFLASMLVPPALDDYMRLSDDDRKDYSKIEEALRKEFQKGQLNREEAIHILATRKQQPDETPQTFAYKVVELVKLAYPSFANDVRLTIAKDYYLRGVHQDMQVALKSGSNFEASDVHALAVETVRLELAGIRSFSETAKASAASINVVEECQPEGDIVNAVAEKVFEKLQQAGVSSPPSTGANFTGAPSYRGRGRGRGRNDGGRGRGRGRNGGSSGGDGNQQRKCRACKQMGHFVRECPQRFCQSCGQKGHDGWSNQCPNYEA